MGDLRAKAIDIKGKKYVLIADRVLAFNEMYPNGSIITCLKSDIDSERVVFEAIILPDTKNPSRIFKAHSQAIWGDGYINKTSALENAETSAVGRALALMGIGIIDSIASADEIRKAEQTEQIQESNWRAKFLKSCEEIKPKLEPGAYERILEDFGYSTLDQVENRTTAELIYIKFKLLSKTKPEKGKTETL